MLTADQSGIARFADELQRSNVVKLTHHGQIDGMPPCLIDICKPSFFIICADSKRTYNSARPEIIAKAEDYLKKESIAGQIFITGMLNRNFSLNEEICAVGFECKENLLVGIRMGTWNFQAKLFYEKLGYKVFGEIKDCPPNTIHYDLKKVFSYK